MFTYDSHPVRPPDISCRQNAWLPSTKSGQSQATRLARDARRRRVELRRIRSLSQTMSRADTREENATEGTPMDLGGGRPAGRRRPYGNISVVGRRREMNDVVEVKLGFAKRGEESYDFYGIFDGHEGRRVALTCSQTLLQMLAMIIEDSEEEIDWEEAMIEGFDEVEAKINKNNGAAVMGSHTVVAVVGDSEVVVAAKYGGSKAVVCRGGEAVRLLEDQKAVSCTKNDEGQGSSSSSSCMNMKEMQVRVSSVGRNREDEFLILGSRGFWNVMSDEVACQVARIYCCRGRGDDGAEAAAALMAEMALARGSRDNVSVILVDLRDETNESSPACDGNGI